MFSLSGNPATVFRACGLIRFTQDKYEDTYQDT
jgi:hypothetical protein